MDEGKRDVKNIVEVIKVIFTVLKKFQETLEDGFQVTDILTLIKWALKDEKFKEEMKLALDDLKSIPLEALDLKVSEIVVLWGVIKEGLAELGIDLETGKLMNMFSLLKKVYDFIKRFL